MAGKVWLQEREAAAHRLPVAGTGEMNAGIKLAFSSTVTFRMGLPI